MIDDAPASVLGRMTHRQQAASPDVPLTASRAVRLAVTRAAAQSIGLTVNVLGMGEETCDLDNVLGQIAEDHLILQLDRGGTAVGVMVCDPALVAAALEVQTVGRVASKAGDTRPLTRADVALVRPVLTAVTAELENTTPRTALDGWVAGAVPGVRLDDARAASFALPDQSYRVVRLSLELGGTERQAELLIVLPMQLGLTPVKKPAAKVPDWSEQFQAAIMAAPARLDAVLHRFPLPLSVATTLEVGQVLPLTGCTVGAIRLVDPTGETVARAKLGQIAGQIAVRVQDLDMVEMDDLPGPAAIDESNVAQLVSPPVQGQNSEEPVA